MDAIRRILIDDWDPIGIQGAGPEDEYDSYIAGLYRLLIRKPSENEIIEHLRATTMVPTGSTRKDRKKLETVARKLLGVNLALQ